MSQAQQTPATSNGEPIACERCHVVAATETVLDDDGNERHLCPECAAYDVEALDLRPAPAVWCDCPRCEAITAASLRGAA